MKITTPEERFKNLPGYDFEPNFININGMQVHYVDECGVDEEGIDESGVEKGKQGADETILCLHGQPSWSYLYRKMIPPLAKHFRVVAPDFIGFGRSEKYTDYHQYTTQMHVDTLGQIIEQLDLQNITLVLQDWAGPTALIYAAENPGRIKRLVLMNTLLAHNGYLEFSSFKKIKMSAMFMMYRLMTRKTDFSIGVLINGSTVSKVPREVIKAYSAPFPDKSYKAGASAWPSLVPLFSWSKDTALMKKAWNKLASWEKPVLVMFSDQDPFTQRWADRFHQHFPGAKGVAQITINDAGHFLQEDKGEEIAQHIIEFVLGEAEQK